MQCRPFSIYDTTVTQLREWLDIGALTSVDITSAYLDQIERHNTRGFGLRAVIDSCPRDIALAHAKKLDDERANGNLRGSLHGIPILVKDLYNTDPALGMGTTCGSQALRGARPRRNAAIIDLILEAGAIVIAKTNLSELANVKGMPPCTGGWSAAGGQALSPYVRGGVDPNDTFLGHSTPTGSSSGSAAGVAAGFGPISIGSETDGSIAYPATRAGLYGLKLSHGAYPLDGTLPFHPDFDCHGVFAKTPQDILHFLAVFPSKSAIQGPLSASWTQLKVGLLDPEVWQMGPGEIKPSPEFTAQSLDAMRNVPNTIKSAGGEVVEQVTLTSVEEIAKMEDGVDFDIIAFDSWRNNIDSYLKDFEYSPVQSLHDMIEYNKAHAAECLPKEQPSQKFLEDLLVAEPDPEYPRKLQRLRELSKEAIESAMQKHSVDALIASGEGRICAVAAAAGYACGTLPLGFADFNGRAFGMHVVTRGDCSTRMLAVMSAWETTFREGVKAPPLLKDAQWWEL